MGACTTSSRGLMIITELLPHDLNTMLFKDGQKIKTVPLQRLKMLRDVALGVNWMHCSDPMMLHLDLKPANLLIDEFGRTKVGDFGQTLFKVSNHICCIINVTKRTEKSRM